MKNTSTAAVAAESSFWDLSEIEITLSYDFLNQSEPMRFFLRPQMNKEAIEANQSWLALTKEDREKKDHDNNVQMLAALTVREPENVPSFEKGTPIADFFAGENPMKKKVAADVISRYYRITQPKEFFR